MVNTRHRFIFKMTELNFTLQELDDSMSKDTLGGTY